jgi:hypothetical protein
MEVPMRLLRVFAWLVRRQTREPDWARVIRIKAGL